MCNMKLLEDYGWTDDLRQTWKQVPRDNLQPARVIADYGTSLQVAMPDERTAELTGKLAHYSQKENTPKIGDWVAVRSFDNGNVVIEQVLPRKNEIARKVAGKRVEKQVIAANVDLAFVVMALDADFSLERLKRFLYQLSINNIHPVIVLNKADKTDNINDFVSQLSLLALPIITSVATSGSGIDNLLGYIKPAQTIILLGSSGVGKSTLTNRLLGYEAQKTMPVRVSDSSGRHTTVHRQLFMLPNGGLLIDTPGVRELQLWGTEEALNENFEDITELALGCRFTNCQHGNEPGCAIRHALQNKSLNASRFTSYLKFKNELKLLNNKQIAMSIVDSKRVKKEAQRQAKDDMNEMLQA